MKGFKQCEKGHYYKEELESCNYCPKPGISNSTQSGVGEKTQIFGSQTGGSADDKTVVVGSGISSQSQADQSYRRDLNKTFIQGATDMDHQEGAQPPRSTRMITGWIISYTLDPMGMDYRIYEGNNTIGRDVSNSIVIMKDAAVSSRHLTILCKKGKFYLKDEMAANGTFLNGSELAIGVAYDLNDGDEIKLGANTTFKFKSAL